MHTITQYGKIVIEPMRINGFGEKERYRATSIRKFPDSLKERLWEIKEELDNRINLEDLIVEAVENGLPEIERRVFFRIPEFIEEPRDDCL